MLVIDMALTFFLRRPAVFVVLALVDGAFVRPLMGFDVLGQVTRSLKLLVALRALVNLRLGVLLAPCHGTKRLVVIKFSIHVALGSSGWSHFLTGNLATSRKRDDFAVFVTYELSLLSVATQPPVE
jgi:hypothetical protein